MLKVEAAEKIREFNRFYLPKMDLINRYYLKSEFTQTETRILYEIVEKKEQYASELEKKLLIDKGYLSRILNKFENKGLIERNKDDSDKRFSVIFPTEKAIELTEELVNKANREITDFLKYISAKNIEKIVRNMEEIQEILEDAGNENH